MSQMKTSLISLLLMLFLAACTAATTPEQQAAPDATGTPPPTATSAVTPTAESEAPVEAARQALGERLEIAPAQIEVSSTEEMEWPDACLGLAEEGEMCAQVITPGYLIALRAEGQVYEVRTDRDGGVVRIQETADPDQEYPAAAIQARMALASQLNVDVADVSIISFERREWNNACLGLAEPDEVCAEVITPGWLVILEAQGRRYEVHTDASGQQIRVGDKRSRQPAAVGEAAVILRREGGIAGEVSEWRLYPSGQVEIMADASARDGTTTQVELDPEKIDALISQIEERGFFDLQPNYLPADTCCDRFTYTLTVNAGGRTHTVRAIEGSDDTPEAVWQSIALVREVLEEATIGQEPER